MVLALDPSVRRVWRDPHSLQFGVDRTRLVLQPVTAAEERMIAALADGVAPAGLRMIAARAHASPHEVDALLDRLRPVLAARMPPAALPAVVIDGDGPTAARMRSLLGDAGVAAPAGLSWDDPAVETAGAAIIVGAYAIEPARYARWLRRDVPHLPVVFGDAGVTVGPLVEPGAGPCLRCLDLHRTDADPAWPAMAAQLFALRRPGETELVIGAVASVAVAAVVGRLRAGAAEAIGGASSAGAASGVDAAGAADASEAAIGTAGRRDAGAGASGTRDAGSTATSVWAREAARFDPASGLWSRVAYQPHAECGCRELPVTPRSAAGGDGSGAVRRGGSPARSP